MACVRSPTPRPAGSRSRPITAPSAAATINRTAKSAIEIVMIVLSTTALPPPAPCLLKEPPSPLPVRRPLDTPVSRMLRRAKLVDGIDVGDDLVAAERKRCVIRSLQLRPAQFEDQPVGLFAQRSGRLGDLRGAPPHRR